MAVAELDPELCNEAERNTQYFPDDLLDEVRQVVEEFDSLIDVGPIVNETRLAMHGGPELRMASVLLFLGLGEDQ